MSTALSHSAVNMQMPRANPATTATWPSSNSNCNGDILLGSPLEKTNKCLLLAIVFMCAYVTLVNTKRKCAKCDISHDLCTDNDKSCSNSNSNSISIPGAGARATLARPHTLLGQLKLLLLLPAAEYELRSSKARSRATLHLFVLI